MPWQRSSLVSQRVTIVDLFSTETRKIGETNISSEDQFAYKEDILNKR